MKYKGLLILIGVLISVVFVVWFTQNPEQTTVILLRHAEKSDKPVGDVSLSSVGQLRAESLVDIAETAGVTLIYATQYARTSQTAEPLAAKLGLKVNIFEVDHSNPERYARDIAQKIKTDHSGETVLVVSHSNTVPLIIEELGAGIIAPISEDAYGDLFIIYSSDWDERVFMKKVKY